MAIYRWPKTDKDHPVFLRLYAGPYFLTDESVLAFQQWLMIHIGASNVPNLLAWWPTKELVQLIETWQETLGDNDNHASEV